MSSSADTLSTPLRALANIISTNVQTLESAYTRNGATFPDLKDPFAPSALDADPALNETARTIVAAAYQIIAAVRPPHESIQEYATGCYSSMALNLVVDLNIPNILKEAGGQVRRYITAVHEHSLTCCRACMSKIFPSRPMSLMTVLVKLFLLYS
jgi:hypothetical protein